MDAVIYNQKGQSAGQTTLNEALFGLRWNSDLVHQVVTGIQANSRQNSAYARGRGEVRGGGKKPWRQKGTGRSRHGSSRSPIWIGGGVTHGPTLLRTYDQKINRKMRAKALFTLLSRKWRDGDMILVEALAVSAPKTKLAGAYLSALSKLDGFNSLVFKTGNRALVIIPEHNEVLLKSFRNLPGVSVVTATDVSALDLALYKKILLLAPEVSLPVLTDRAVFLKSEAKVKKVKAVKAKPAKKVIKKTVKKAPAKKTTK